jgi:hypothetical protein
MKVRTHLVLSLIAFVFSVVTLVAALTIRGEPVRA